MRTGLCSALAESALIQLSNRREIKQAFGINDFDFPVEANDLR